WQAKIRRRRATLLGFLERLSPHRYGSSASIGVIRRRNLFTAVTKHARHPDELVEEFVHAPDKSIVEQFAPFIEKRTDFSEVHVLENCNETELARHRQEALDYPRAAKRSSRDAANPNRLVNVFFQVHVQRVFQKPGITMIVFWHNEDDSIALLDRRRERCVFHLLSLIIEPHRNLAHVDQLCFHIHAFLCLLKNKTRHAFALSPLTSRSENHWNKKWAFHLSQIRKSRSEIKTADVRTRTGTSLLQPNGFKIVTP